MKIRKTLENYAPFIWTFAIAFIILSVLYKFKDTLLPFMVGLLLAYLLMPIIKFIEKWLPGKSTAAETKRALAIGIIYISFMGVFAFAAFITITTLVHQANQIMANASTFVTAVMDKGHQLTAAIYNNAPADVKGQVDGLIKSFGDSMTGSLSGSATAGNSIVTKLTGSLGLVAGFAAVPLFLFYIMKDSEKIQENIYKELPPTASKHTKAVVGIVECVLGRYIRAQILIGSIVGVVSFAGLLIFKVPFVYALPLAFANGFFDMIPTIGPFIGGALVAVVVLALVPGAIVPVLILLVVIQVLKNIFIVPKVASTCLRLHASVIIFLLVIGGVFWGVWGVVLLVPIVATLVDVFVYVRELNAKPGTKLPETALPSD
jgi:predicted PurR-regulated permease PerM